jgi:hypothetical protein
MQVQQEWWQLSKFEEASRRMTPHHEAVVAVEGASPPVWLSVADIIVGEHRTRRQARAWIASVQSRYPGCLLAVARQRRGRWLLMGFPARNVLMLGGRFELADAEQFGRVVYRLWSTRRAEL